MGSELLTKTSAEHRARVPARAMRQAPWTTVPLEHASIRDCISEKEQRTHYSRGVGAAANKSWTSSQRRCVSKSRTTTNTEHLAMEASAGMSRPMSIRDHHAIASSATTDEHALSPIATLSPALQPARPWVQRARWLGSLDRSSEEARSPQEADYQYAMREKGKGLTYSHQGVIGR